MKDDCHQICQDLRAIAMKKREGKILVAKDVFLNWFITMFSNYFLFLGSGRRPTWSVSAGAGKTGSRLCIYLIDLCPGSEKTERMEKEWRF